MRRRFGVFVACLALVLASAPAGPVEAEEPQGPPLSIDEETLAAALTCPDVFTSERRSILLVHGTAVTADEHWGWNYATVLPDQGFDVCWVQLPDRAFIDIQITSEYVVHAIRHIAEASDGTIDVMGHSQGGLQPRWALRWWPDTRELVENLITLASPHHGTLVADLDCFFGQCTPSVWQMRTDSRFLEVLNAQDETPGDVSYTSIYSAADELVQPHWTAELDGASNILIQDLCPGRPVHHIGLNHDAVVYDLVRDALDNPGPADPARFDPLTCLERTMPGVSVTDAFFGNMLAYGSGAQAFAGAEQADEEPETAEYAS